jgi:hypothetical protein
MEQRPDEEGERVPTARAAAGEEGECVPTARAAAGNALEVRRGVASTESLAFTARRHTV